VPLFAAHVAESAQTHYNSASPIDAHSAAADESRNAMPAQLHLFGLVHLLILASVPALAALLVLVQRRLAPGSRGLRFGMAAVLAVSSALYYAYFAMHGQLTFPDRLPLELCDVSLWLVVIALLTLKPAIFDLAYYGALAGAGMSLLTPNVPESYPHFLSVQYFLDHGLMVTAVLFLVWSGQARPRTGSVGRAMLYLNLYAAFAGAFDFIFKTDYMFLRAKPETDTLLTILGPWPWYILVCEGVALGLFLLLYLPFRRTAAVAA
jgi:hypothetical integral membrane protein (TIGR02206 family)